MTAPAAISAPRSTTAVGWIRAGSVMSNAPERAHLLLQGAYPSQQLGQHPLGRPDPSDLAGRDVADHTCLRQQDRPFPDGGVISQSHLSREHGPAADLARAGHTYLAGQDHVLPNIAVVRDLHEVVDLRP